jgi:hypothetical protein
LAPSKVLDGTPQIGDEFVTHPVASFFVRRSENG